MTDNIVFVTFCHEVLKIDFHGGGVILHLKIDLRRDQLITLILVFFHHYVSTLPIDQKKTSLLKQLFKGAHTSSKHRIKE